jgi:nucleotide-binding universal stress UspA family protein
MFKKIVCATDFTEAAKVATRYAASIARMMDSSLDLVHAWHFATELPNELASLRHEVISTSRDTDRAKLDALVADLAKHGVKASAALVEGSPDSAVPDYAKARGADLIVVGTQASTGLTHALLGSVAERILRTSVVPVLVVPKNMSIAPDAVFAPREILVPTDLSPASSDALRLAVALGKRCVARVTTLHAWEVPPYFFEGGDRRDQATHSRARACVDGGDVRRCGARRREHRTTRRSERSDRRRLP